MAEKIWTSNEIPDQKGKTIIITGATSGIGFEAAKILAKKGAKIILPVRNLDKGQNVAQQIKSIKPDAEVEIFFLDISDLESVRKFADEANKKLNKIDLLLNNAGIMWIPRRKLSKQNYDLQFATNHLGHFLLTGLLLPKLKITPNSRVITQSSILHKKSSMQNFEPNIYFDDLTFEKQFDTKKAYAQSKLANLLFTYELDRRLKATNSKTIAVACHPGYTATNLQNNGGLLVKIMNILVAQKVNMGVLPMLRAATEPNLKGSEYFGPTKLNELKGYPELVRSSAVSYDTKLAEKLWQISEGLVNHPYDFS